MPQRSWRGQPGTLCTLYEAPVQSSPAVSSALRCLVFKPQTRVGVIGCGRIGRAHLSALSKSPFVQVEVVADQVEAAAVGACQDFGVSRFTTDAQDVIADADVDAVWICSPSQFHSDQIRHSAAAGKHIFCEKPLALDLHETVDVVRLCEQRNVKLMTAFQRRFDANFQRLKMAVETGEAGRPVQLRLCSRDPSPPPRTYVDGGGGIFKDMAIHDLDMSCFILNEEPRRILARGSNMVQPEVADLSGSEAFDTANILVEFESGVVASIEVCRKAAYGYDQRAELLGTEGMLQSENVFPTTVRKHTGSWVGQADMPHDFFMNRYASAYEQETFAFARAITEDSQAPCDGWAGVRALRMALAADRSAAEQRWIDMDEIEFNL